MKDYDVIVVGAGHAGCEAAFAAARMGAQTLLITFNMDHIAQMSCNPAVGGVAKGHLVREIDALGGAQGMITDRASIQFRLLNRTKGPAVWSPRAQCDKVCYQKGMKFFLEMVPNLDILQSEVTSFLLDSTGKLNGVVTLFGQKIRSRAIVLTTGTFLRGRLHFGLRHFVGGRAGDPAATELSQALSGQLGLELGRLKTGTPPRVLAKTMDFSQMDYQPAEPMSEEFSFFAPQDPYLSALPCTQKREMPCYMVYSTQETAKIVRENLMQAPLYQGKIEGIGARYCPSFEDKVVRFAHHEKHLLFMEPEGEFTGEYYLNGISTSLPPEIQMRMLHTVKGLENAVISRYAYAIEYDFIFPHQMNRTFGSRKYPNLFTAGQINGTSGYEEAAGQGLLAGCNAARVAMGRTPVELSRDQAYLGVLADDLVSKEIVEPYRLFTSRAEYRLHLRQDNAELRLAPLAHELGLLSEQKYQYFLKYRQALEDTTRIFHQIRHHGKDLFTWFKEFHGDYSAAAIPESLPMDFWSLPELAYLTDCEFTDKVLREIAVEAHYDGYLEREAVAIQRLKKLEDWQIPADFDYSKIPGLCNESRAKLIKAAPSTLAQAERLDGVKPPEIALLQIHLTRYRQQHAAAVPAEVAIETTPQNKQDKMS